MDAATALALIAVILLAITTLIQNRRIKWMCDLVEEQQRTIQVMNATQSMIIASVTNAQQRLDILQAPQPPRQGPPVPLEIVRKATYEQGV